MSKRISYKYCLMRSCKSTTVNVPTKRFFAIPCDVEQRKKWLSTCGRESFSDKTIGYVCEDHFLLKEDLSNYWQFTMQKGTHARFKREVVPRTSTSEDTNRDEATHHIRSPCQQALAWRKSINILKLRHSPRSVRSSPKFRYRGTRIASPHRHRKPATQFISPGKKRHSPWKVTSICVDDSEGDMLLSTTHGEQALSKCTVKQDSTNLLKTVNSPAIHNMTAQALIPDSTTRDTSIRNLSSPGHRHTPAKVAEFTQEQKSPWKITSIEATPRRRLFCDQVVPLDLKAATTCHEQNDSFSSSNHRNENRSPSQLGIENNTSVDNHNGLDSRASRDAKTKSIDSSEGRCVCVGNQHTVQYANKATQVRLSKPYRSKGIQVRPNTRDVSCTPTLIDVRNVACSPIKKFKVCDASDIYSSSENSESQVSSDESDKSWSSESDDSLEDCDTVQRTQYIEQTRELNSHHSMFYMGIPADCTGIIELLANAIKYRGRILKSTDVVCLILNKIRLGDCNKRLSHNYGVSESYISKLFNKYVPCISNCMRSLVCWLPVESVYLHLPVAYWARYRDVYCVIDTFEIECEHPSNAYDQACTYSDYKSCNTYKYLIGMSPDGTIMFLSKGYLGRFSDIKIAVDSNFIKEVPRGCSVLADRGFKGIDTYLQERNCKLIRPPSTQGTEKYSRSDAIAGRVIASLRIHVERLIRRLREFDMLKPHAVVSHSYSNLIDDIVAIAAGLVNLQPSLIR